MTIGMSVSIIAPNGVTAFSTASSGTVVTVAAGPSDVVTLRGVTVSGSPTTSAGVAFNSGLALNLENCIINGSTIGVVFNRTGDPSKPELQILHCIISNSLIGLDMSNLGALPTGHGNLRALAVAPPSLVYATIKDSAFLLNTYAIEARDDSNTTLAGTMITGSSSFGVYAIGSDNHPSYVSLDGCTITRSGYGIGAGDGSGSQLAHAFVLLAHCQITGNDYGIGVTPTGQTLSQVSNSVVTNTIIANSINGVPSGTYNAQ